MSKLPVTDNQGSAANVLTSEIARRAITLKGMLFRSNALLVFFHLIPTNMDGKPIDIEILESTPKFVKVKLPFLDVPIEMDQQYFQPRMEKGYFRLWKKYDQPDRQKITYRHVPKIRAQ